MLAADILDDPTPIDRRTAHDEVIVAAEGGHWAASMIGDEKSPGRSGCTTVKKASGAWPFGVSVPRWMAEVILPLDRALRAQGNVAGFYPEVKGKRVLVARGANRAAQDREYAEALWAVHTLDLLASKRSAVPVKRLLAFIRETVDVAR